MRWVTCQDKSLQIDERSGGGRSLVGQWTPQRAMVKGAVHELLFDGGKGGGLGGQPLGVAVWCLKEERGPVVWCESQEGVGDGGARLYPPGVRGGGDTYLLRTGPADLVWTVAECLRCRGVGAVVAAIPRGGRLTRVEARRLQLAAEQGGSMGVLMRPLGRWMDTYAAATRWRVEPARGDRRTQRWQMELVHGHGGQIGRRYLLESDRAGTHRGTAHRGEGDGFKIVGLGADGSVPVRSPAALGDYTAFASSAGVAG